MIRRFAKSWFGYVLIGLVVGIYIFFMHFPAPTTDSGVFLYIGEKILQGKMPYVDVWDHKPPGIFYINAVSQIVTPHSLIGIWIVEFIFVVIAASLVFKLLKKQFGFTTSVLCIAGYLCALLPVINGGNLPEEYFLLPQSVAVYLFLRFERDELWKFVIIGFLGGISVLLKENLIGIFIAIGIYILVRDLKDRNIAESFKKFLCFGVGLLLPIGFMILYFFVRGGLYDMYRSFIYNFYYSGLLRENHFLAILHGLSVTINVMLFAFVGWIVVFYRLFKRKGVPALVTLAFIDLPIEVLLSIVSGRQYWQYFAPWLLPGVVLMGVVIFEMISVLKRVVDRGHLHKFGRGFVFLWILLFMALLDMVPLVRYWQGLVFNYPWYMADLATVEFIKSHTNPSQRVLIWGANPEIYFLTQRDSPTKYIYITPFFVPGYQNPQMIDEFLKDVKTTKRPVYVVDITLKAHFGDRNLVKEAKELMPANIEHFVYRVPPQMGMVYSYLRENYMPVGTIGHYEWRVYRIR